jgi:hypothetical protein
LQISQPGDRWGVGFVGPNQCGGLADLAVPTGGVASKSQSFVFELLELPLHLVGDTCDYVLDQFRRVTNLLDLLDDEILDLLGGNRL